MRYEVSITFDAARDLAEIRAYLAENESAARAEQVLAALQQLVGTLADMPRRGHVTPELALIGRTEFRELHHQAYRAIYTIADRTVTVLAVADGRRDMQGFLARRLLRA